EMGLPPTRSQGEASVVKGRNLTAGEYEFERSKIANGNIWLWADLLIEGGYEYRTSPVAFEASAQPWFLFEGPRAVGSIIFLNAVVYKSVKVERIDGGGTWEIDRDGPISSVDVAAFDDSDNPGLSGAAGQYEITLYSDYIANRDGNTLTAARSVNVNLTGSPATNEITLMTASAPPIDSTTGSVTVKASSDTPDLTIERRYAVNGGAFTSWTTVSGPASAPTTATAFNILGLPTARAVSGQLEPPQYQVD